MPTTVATAIVIAIAVVPGALGSFAFNIIVGLDWRERDWHAAIRYLGFSVLGLGLYVLLSQRFGWPVAAHVIPSTYYEGTLSAAALPALVWPYVGHLCGAALCGAIAAGMRRGVSVISSASTRPCSWDAFARDSLPGRWVVVSLKSGDVFAGYISAIDAGVPSPGRDLVLSEPALYEDDGRCYTATPYHQMFIPADLVQNLATVERDGDCRIGPPIGSKLFSTEESHGKGRPEHPKTTPETSS